MSSESASIEDRPRRTVEGTPTSLHWTNAMKMMQKRTNRQIPVHNCSTPHPRVRVWVLERVEFCSNRRVPGHIIRSGVVGVAAASVLHTGRGASVPDLPFQADQPKQSYSRNGVFASMLSISLLLEPQRFVSARLEPVICT
eukprot:2684847-Rhodomonas_salina.2